MPRDGVPKRILRLREIGKLADCWSVAPAIFAEGRRTLRKWLADPDVPPGLKAGDADLLERFERHHAKRRRPRFHLVTQEEMDVFTPEELEHMLTVELRRTHADDEQVAAMREAKGQTLH